MIKGMRLNPKLVALLRADRAAFAMTMSLGFAGGIAGVLFAWLMSRTINAVFLNENKLGEVSALLVGMIGAAGVRALANWGSEAAASRLALGIKSRLRMQLVEHLFALGPAYTRGERGERDVRTGELTNSLTEGVEALDAYFSQYLPQIALAALIPLSALIFIFPLDPLSGFVLLLTAPLIPVFMILIGSTSEAMTKRQWLNLSRMSAYILDVLQGLATLKLLGRSKAQIQTIAEVSERLRGTTMDVLRVTFLSALTLELVTTISTAVVAVQVGLRLLYGYLGFEEAFFVLLLAPEFYLPLRMLGTRFHAGMSGTAAARRIFEILEVKKEEDRCLANAQGRNQGRSFSGARDRNFEKGGSIEFKGVSVHYRDGRTALDGVSFEIKAGSRTALVGESGAGKSTIAALLLRFIEPQGGEIWVPDNQLRGTLLREMPADAWRESIAWVAQENYLFNDSVETNIRLGCPQASREEVIQAARLANAHDFIQVLPDGYRTVIGERGARLSAGQAQRIALARAFLRDAPILILDEPSAHLDPQSEALVMKATERLMSGRTTLVIAHRLNTIYQSDQIILLSKGRVETCGTHQELLARSEIYRRLVMASSEASGGIGLEISSMSLPREAACEVQLSGQIIDQEEAPAKRAQPFVTIKRLLGFLSSYKWRVVLSVLLGWATISSGIGLMATSAFIIAKAAQHPPIAELQVAIVGVRFFGISRGCFRYLERLVSHDLALRILARLRVWLYRLIEPLAPARLSTYHSGDLLKRMTGEISSLENLYVRGIAPPLVAVLVAVSSALFLSRFNFGLAIVFLLFIIAGGIGLPWIVQRLSRQAGRDVIQSQGEMSAAIVDGLQGLPELLSFGAVERYRELVADIQRKLARAQGCLGRIGSAQTAGLGLLGQLATLAVLSAAIGLVGSGRLEGLYLGVIALAVLTSFEALQPLPQAAQALESNLEAANRLFAIADATPAVQEPDTPSQLAERWDVEVRELCFSYPAEGVIPEGQVLEGISFELPQGKHMAVVGPSGAGKSTLIRLLTRSWEYETGSILLNGNELRQYAGDELRKKMAVVPQNPYLFTATILDNLRIARPQASMQEIIHAAQLGHIHDFIEGLPQGYHTWVGEHGLRLSAGERQRIAVARALLMDTPLLVLDEATANLDALTEHAMLMSIYQAMQGRSLLVITHRLVGMEGLDEILVLDGGRVVERGTHAELLEERGFYWRMWKVQQGMG